MSDRDQLLAMGFPQDRVDWALKATSNRGLQPAMDHILENNDNPVPDLSVVSHSDPPKHSTSGDAMDEDEDDAAVLRAAIGLSTGGTSQAGGAVASATTEAKSIKCSQCGKIFKNVDLANFHAEKSGHDQFEESAEEIKPLTEEEKKQKLEELRAKMAEKKTKKAAQDLEENKANEALRRKAGKDQTAAREELKLKQAAKDAEAKRRVEDAKAKAAIKAQIEADKKARAEKAAKEKALREGKSWTDAGPSSTAATPTAIPTTVASATKGAEYKDTRLQIRLVNGGTPIAITLPSDKTLHDVAIHAASHNDTIEVDTVTFSTTFPRKTFSRADFTKSLRELGLTPSAVLQAS
ncbi:hypothetical protein BS47DRAFT_1371517 [Hydnum rufescens UP504]|uniref:Uncharacterized protein n=1 Tax=Hydnum rufescens UP504 TaxID=1448309 RepID=A0A9P6B551_9AGAM|nr:hypothetical protein BS47DRAFT_1371517 [Hydnum rufescens UP504]